MLPALPLHTRNVKRARSRGRCQALRTTPSSVRSATSSKRIPRAAGVKGRERSGKKMSCLSKASIDTVTASSKPTSHSSRIIGWRTPGALRKPSARLQPLDVGVDATAVRLGHLGEFDPDLEHRAVVEIHFGAVGDSSFEDQRARFIEQELNRDHGLEVETRD